ncbi:hypothetical protein [Spirillospora sp. CA-294931]|uniref:hypothetical protein n=1 Tax=Spirillospora sp. CA-294931 TaxID=3240042 RepID=UPI003D940221
MSQIMALTIANSRLGRPLGARTPDEFERALDGVAWFANLGRPSRWDAGCVRIHDWDDWPGPENPLGEAFAEAYQEIRDHVDPDQELFDRVHAAVMDRARTAVPFEPDQDSWHGPTLCVWEAAHVAALIVCVLARGWDVPDDLVEQWNWYEAGHWPSSFADDPADTPTGDLTFPRRLLVY